ESLSSQIDTPASSRFFNASVMGGPFLVRGRDGGLRCLHDGRGGETEFFKHRARVGGGAELLDGDRPTRGTQVLVPRCLDASLHAHPSADSAGKYGLAVLLALGVEPFEAGGRNHPRGDAFGLELRLRIHGE